MNIFGLSLTFRRSGHAGRWSLWICCACLAASSGYAQGPSLQEMHDDLTLFSGILSEALKLNDPGGLFGRRLGGISSTYLVNQGAVFEVRSPLANRRNRMGLASLSSAMQSLQLQENPFSPCADPCRQSLSRARLWPLRAPSRMTDISCLGIRSRISIFLWW